MYVGNFLRRALSVDAPINERSPLIIPFSSIKQMQLSLVAVFLRKYMPFRTNMDTSNLVKITSVALIYF